jgi:hypothetical protein
MAGASLERDLSVWKRLIGLVGSLAGPSLA